MINSQCFLSALGHLNRFFLHSGRHLLHVELSLCLQLLLQGVADP